MEETKKKIAEQIKQIIADQLCIKVEEIKDGDQLIADHGADSLDIVEIYIEIESNFQISVPFDDEDPETVISTIIEYYTNLILEDGNGIVTH